MKNKKDTHQSLYIVLPLISILAVLVIGIIWIRPRIDSIMEKQAKITEEKNQQVRMDAKIEKLNTLNQNKTDLLARLAAVNVALPTQKDVPTLVIQLQKIAQESDVAIQGIQLAPGKLVNDNAPASKTGPEIQLNLSVQGNYEAIKTFLGKVYRAKRLINMDTLSVTTAGADDNSLLTISMVMNTYYQPLPPRSSDESAEVQELTKADKDTYDTLQSYTAYALDNNVVITPIVQPESSASASRTASEAPETSASAKP